MKKIFKNICLLFFASLPFFLTSYVLFLKDPLPWPDEAIYLDMARNILLKGNLALSVFGDAILGMKENALWYPPLFFYVLAGWIRIFGQSIESIRIMSFILGLSSLAVFFIMAKNIFKNNLLATVGTLMLAFDVNFSRAGRIARMDMLTFLLIELSFLFLIIVKSKKRNFYFIFSGIFAGLSILTHPMGAIALIIVVVYFFTKCSLKNKITNIFRFFIPVLFLNSPWLVKIIMNLNLFMVQYGFQLKRKAIEIPYIFRLFQTDFSWWLFFAVYLMIFLIFIAIFLKNKNKFILFIIISFLISSVYIILGKEGWYFIYFQPFIVLMILYLIRNFRLFGKLTSQLFFVIIFLYFLTNIILLNGFIQPALGLEGNYHDFTKQIKAQLPLKANLYLSTIPDPYFDLKNNQDYRLLEFLTVPVDEDTCNKLLLSVDYLIINHVDWICYNSTIDFINKHAEKVTTVNNNIGYSTKIIKFKKNN